MSGLYIHIPFCKQKCIYCDFHSSATREDKAPYIQSLINEIELNKSYLSEPLKTIYFGGGTPSLLNQKQINQIFDSINNSFDTSNIVEITFEANPENLTKEYLNFLKTTPINRLSIGIQSFDDNDLKTIGRRHSAIEAINAVNYAKNIGFKNISIDLMFGLPNMNLNKWQANILKAIELNTEHISAYCLTVEEGTMLDTMIKKKKLSVPSDEENLEMFDLCIDKLQSAGYEHYETSNYSKNGFHSVHNSSYWNNTPYLGLGISAHSFNGKERRWNIGDNKYESEILSIKDFYNEYILVGIRIKEGMDLSYIKDNFSIEYYNHFIFNANKLQQQELLSLENNHYILTRKGMHIANSIGVELMM